MQIKRRLSALSKRFDNDVEGLNIAVEINRICDRLDELADYADAKVEAMKAREKSGKSLSMRQHEAIQSRRDEIAQIHAAESAEAQADQEESKKEPVEES